MRESRDGIKIELLWIRLLIEEKGSSFVVARRATRLHIAQKAKIKWVIEGDENSNLFHGVLNRKTQVDGYSRSSY